MTDAQSKLAGDNIALAYYWARRCWRNRPELQEDFEDAALDGLMCAARAFEVDRGRKFSTLASRCIRQAIRARIKYLARRKRNPGGRILSLDAGHFADDGPEADAEVPADPEPGPDFEAIIRPLRHRDRVVLRLRYRDGETLQAVGDRLGLTRERVRQIEAKALRRLASKVTTEGNPCPKLPASFCLKTLRNTLSGASGLARNVRPAGA